MPLRKMPNGEYVDVPDDISPDALKRIESQYRRQARRERQAQAATPPRASSEPSEQDEVQSRVARKREAGIGAAGALSRGYLMNMTDELAGGVGALVKGVPAAIRKGDIGQIPRNYRISRDVERQLAQDRSQDSPASDMALEITGAVANPIGTGAGALKGLGTVASKAGLTGAARALGGGARNLATGGPLKTAIATGAVHGGLNAAGAAEELSDVPEAVARGSAMGAIVGGGVGGGVNALVRGSQILRDAGSKAASRTANMRINELLKNADDTAAGIRSEIKATDAAGGDAMVMDMSPGLRGMAGAISRKPSVQSSNKMIDRGEARIDDRRSRFGEGVSSRAKELPTTDAYARAQGIEGTRKAAGQRDYGPGGAMDEPVKWNDELDNFVNGPQTPEATRRAMQNAYDELKLRREDPNLIGTTDPQGNLVIYPSNFRAFDYMKRGFDTEIGKAIKAGDNATAQGLSKELNTLKGLLGDQNPEYVGFLATQRDLFQKVRAIELGESGIARLIKDPRSLLRDWRALPKEEQLEARIGFIDALMAKDTKAAPIDFVRSVMRNPAQRKVFEFAFGGKKELSSFEKFVTREARASKADQLTAPGRQSETARFKAADDELGPAGNVAVAGVRGLGFGGQTGMWSNAWAKMQEYAGGMSPKVQEEIAKILLSKGEGLEQGTIAARQYMKRRERTNKRYAQLAAKGAQQPVTTVVGGS